MECNNCNETLHKNSKFCHICGYPQQPKCATCNADLSPQSNFCSNCGKAIGVSDPIDKFDLAGVGISDEDWVNIPSGQFIMGSPESDEIYHDKDERQHHVTVGEFQLLKTPVTFLMYDKFCDAVGKEKPSDEGWGRDDRPVINVSFWDAVDYCEWLSKKSGYKIRLPTEAEWEYACRAGTTTRYSYGDVYDKSLMHIDFDKHAGAFKTMPVKQFPENPWGLYDMHGNVQEWCASFHDSDYSGLETQSSMDDRDDNEARVLRGGSSNMFGLSAKRSLNFAVGVTNSQGFRIAR